MILTPTAPIAISFTLQGVKYNIPVAIWLTEQYPQQAPLAYVVPTPDMIIKPRHSFVDASGEQNCLHEGVPTFLHLMHALVCLGATAVVLCRLLSRHGGTSLPKMIINP